MEMKELRLYQIRPNPLQPREVFDKEKLKELAATIADVGVLQPILVRPTKNDHYEIIAGERRWKATQIAGIETIPALIKPLPDSQVMVESLIENVHRANLKPIEQAKAILEVFKTGEKNFSEKFIDDRSPQKISGIDMKIRERYKKSNELTKEETMLNDIVKRIGLTHIVVYKSLKLLSLPESIQTEATEKGVGKDHLVSISAISDESDQLKVFDVVVDKHLSKEETASLTKVVKSAPEPVKCAVLDSGLDVETAEEITVAFEDLPDDATEQVTEEVVEMVSKGRTDAYITKHIETRQWEAERMADPAFKDPVEYDRNVHERFANGIIKQCRGVQDIFIGRIVEMPKIHQDRSVIAILTAHKHLERDIQFLHQKGVLTTDAIDGHRADCALQLTHDQDDRLAIV